MDKVIKYLFSANLYISIIIIIISIILYNVLRKINKKIIEKNKNSKNNKNKKKKATYLRLFNNMLKYIILVACIVVILQVNGINISSVLVGLGIVSVIAGLALQDALKDIIMGFNLIVDNYFQVGDVIKIGEVEGKVLELGLKATKIEDINNHNILVIANRNIDKALTVSTQLDIDIPTPYEEKIVKLEKVITSILEEIKNDKNVKKTEYIGINEYGESAVIYRIRIWCNPEYKQPVKRKALGIIKNIYDDNHITIPYKQVDIHNFK